MPSRFTPSFSRCLPRDGSRLGNLYRDAVSRVQPEREISVQNRRMGTVTIGRSQRITFDEVSRGSDGAAIGMFVEVELTDLKGRREVAAHYASGFHDLSEFFEDLAEHWTGWPGAKTYRSQEGDLQLTASHTGHVELGFTLQDPSFPEAWSLRGQLTLDAGEELTQAN